MTVMLCVGWSTFFLSWILNIIYYKIHPAEVDFGDWKQKLGLVSLKKGREKTSIAPTLLRTLTSLDGNKHDKSDENLQDDDNLGETGEHLILRDVVNDDADDNEAVELC